MIIITNNLESKIEKQSGSGTEKEITSKLEKEIKSKSEIGNETESDRIGSQKSK